MTTATDALKEYDAKLARFDWFYEMSDDQSVWERGRAAHSLVLAEAKKSPQHQELYDLWKKRWFTGKPWGTPKFTKEELDVERARLGVTP